MTTKLEILDACALLNLYASGFMEAILANRPRQCCVVEQVQKESLFIRKPSDSGVGFDKEPVTLESYFQTGRLRLVKLESENEQNLFVNLAAQIDDGEAATIAVAISRDMQVATDDKKAIRILQQEAPNLTRLSTLDIIKLWSEIVSITPVELKTALENILKYASYRPGKNHHLFEWWQRALNI
jgi:predicted nucleic acid-binding protein